MRWWTGEASRGVYCTLASMGAIFECLRMTVRSGLAALSLLMVFAVP